MTGVQTCALPILLNAMASVLHAPKLPSVGSVLELAYVSHVAVDDDDSDCFFDLLGAAQERARQRSVRLLALGFAHGHPLLAAARSFGAHRAYESVLYNVHWDDAKLVEASGDAIPHPEVAAL